MPELGGDAPQVGEEPQHVAEPGGEDTNDRGTDSGLGAILGDFRGFMDTLLARLAPLVDVSQYEMDHICYRCESREEYDDTCNALCPTFGEVLVETMIGGRPIATIRLLEPIRHRGFEVRCLEVPCPKPGRLYPRGLEHAEFVVGGLGDGMLDNSRLVAFMAEHAAVDFDRRALHKEVNADVSVDFDGGSFGKIAAKFHQRPIYEVVAYELELEARQGRASAGGGAGDVAASVGAGGEAEGRASKRARSGIGAAA